MAAISYAARTGHRARPTLPLAVWLGAFSDWRRVRAAEAQLKALPDHVLDDLGLARGDIVTAVRTGRR